MAQENRKANDRGAVKVDPDNPDHVLLRNASIRIKQPPYYNSLPENDDLNQIIDAGMRVFDYSRFDIEAIVYELNDKTPESKPEDLYSLLG